MNFDSNHSNTRILNAVATVCTVEMMIGITVDEDRMRIDLNPSQSLHHLDHHQPILISQDVPAVVHQDV